MDRKTIKKIRESVTTVVEWDFAQAEGYTIREKYYSLLSKTIEICDSLKENTDGIEWLIAGPEIAAIFETCAHNFVPSPTYKYSYIDILNFKGVVDDRWHLYTDILAPVGEILVGIIPAEEKVILDLDPRCFAKILVKNFLN